MKFSVSYERPAEKELLTLPAAVVQRIYPRIEALASNPKPPGSQKVQVGTDLWRIRVGDYRVLYRVEEEEMEVVVVSVKHRKEAYRK